jgi:hypothetical protein
MRPFRGMTVGDAERGGVGMRDVRTRSMVGLVALATLMAACGGDNDGGDTLLTGFSAVVIVVIIVFLVMRRRR